MAAGTAPNTVQQPLVADARNYWFVLPIDNLTDATDWVLRTENLLPNRIDVYLPRANGDFVHASTIRGSDNGTLRASFASGHHFPVTLASHQHTRLIVRIEATVFRAVPLTLQSAESFVEFKPRVEALVLVCLGVILALLLYNTFLAIGLRDITYGWYVPLAACNLINQAAQFGFFDVFFDIYDHYRYIYVLALYGVSIFATLFTRRFLDLPSLSAPLDRLFVYFIGANLVALLALPFIPPTLHPVIIRVVAFAATLLFLSTGVYAWYRGVKQARFYVLAWGVLMLTICTMILGIIGILPAAFASPITFLVASCIEMLLLSLALADRVVQLQQDSLHFNMENQRKSRFLAAMSHEIRTPLNGVLGLARALTNTHLNPQQREHVQAILTAGNHLNNLLTNVLDYARAQSPGHTIRNRTFNPCQLLHEVATLMGPQVSQKKLNLLIECTSDTPGNVVADIDRTRQVLLNLTHNAVKFTASGSITLGLSHDARPTNQLRFYVKDTGIGISADAKQRIFELFEQANEHITKQFGGTGIGLALAKHLVETMGGKIDVIDNNPAGCIFWFTIPIAPVSEPAQVTIETLLRILVVDDDPINRLVASALLENTGAVVVVASSGSQALELLAGQPFDLILMDLNMPGMDGLETTQNIRKLSDPVKALTPIIGLTAHLFADDHQQCLDCGMNAALLKPLNPDDIMSVYHALLSGNLAQT